MVHDVGVDIDTAVAELYGVPPPDFIATRTRLAKEHPELAKRLRAQRRPTLSAWAVNQLARSAADEVGWLLDVGTELRAAWTSGEHIGGIEQRRGELIARLVRTARDLAADAGHPLRDPAVREVEETLQAASVDPAVAEDVRAGRLAQARSHAGFGFGAAPPAAERAAAPPPPRPPAKRRATPKDREKDHEAELARLEDEYRAAADQADEAARDLTEWEERATAVRAEITQIEEETARLTRALEEIRGRRTDADRRAQVMQRERNRAARSTENARRRADEARTKLERVRRKRAERPEN
jgi:hypothetical protein